MNLKNIVKFLEIFYREFEGKSINCHKDDIEYSICHLPVRKDNIESTYLILRKNIYKNEKITKLFSVDFSVENKNLRNKYKTLNIIFHDLQELNYYFNIFRYLLVNDEELPKIPRGCV